MRSSVNDGEPPHVDLLVFRFSAKVDGFFFGTMNHQVFAVNTLVTLWNQFSQLFNFPLLQLLSFLLHRLEWNSSDFMTALSCKDAFLVLHCGFGNSAVLFAHPHPQGGLFIAYQQGHCVGLFVLSHRQGSFTPWMWFMLSGVSLGRLLLGSLIPSLCFLRVQRRVTQLPELLFFCWIS